MSKPLDYLRLSPVRGQLEPYDPQSPMGWRYVQTTDTLNELKVLIPPGTAAMYEQLLKLERYELTKKSINWPRVIEIRRLKDRMIRKCQKLARAAITPPESLSPFQTCIAPEDFRVKEMERWFREQQKRANVVVVQCASTSTGHVPGATVYLGHNTTHPQCPHCVAGASSARALMAPPTKKVSSELPPQSNLQRSNTNMTTFSKTSSKPGPYPQTQRFNGMSAPINPERSSSLPSNQHQATHSSTRPSVISPPPLPVLLRCQRSEFGLEDEFDPAESVLGDLEIPESSIGDNPSPTALNKGVTISQSSPQSSGDETSPNASGAIARRRSCIKRGSVSEIGAKTVSWADNHDLDNQVSRYASAASDARASGRQWEEVRKIYLEQIAGLETLQLQVQEGMNNLKAESDHLQRIDDMIRHQREQLRVTIGELERRQSFFNEKVKVAIEQADGAVSGHGLHRNTLSITNE